MMDNMQSKHRSLKDHVCKQYRLVEACLGEASTLKYATGLKEQKKKLRLLEMLNIILTIPE